jgi:hypothetical protein
MGVIGSGTLARGEKHLYSVALQANTTYRVYVRPSNSDVDFDLQIYDENGHLVQWDEDLASDALCYVTPRWAGPFQIAVICASGASSYSVIVEP